MKTVIQKAKENKKVVITLGLVFFAALFYNALTPYTTDDFSYMLNFADGTRITNPLQIVPSLWDHYLTINGRVLPHVFVQFLLMFPKWVFNFVNAGVFVLLIWWILNIAEKKKFSSFMFIVVPVALWIYVPAYGQIFLWLTGSANYCWAFLISLLYMKFYIKLLQKPEQVLSDKGIAGLSLFSLFFGAYSEMVSFPVIFICFVIMCVTMYMERSIKRYWKYTIPIVTGAMGYLTLVFSPGAASRATGLSLGTIFKRFIDIFESYYTCTKPLLLMWGILLVIAIYFKVNKKAIVISVSFFMVNFIAMAMLPVASYVVARHYAIPVFYLIVANVVLLQEVRDKGTIGCLPYCIGAYLIVMSLWSLWEGTYDIYDVYRQNSEREAYIYEQVASGEEVITVTMIRPLTKYSCKYDLKDIGIEESSEWPNPEIAKYYGLKMIYGVEP